MKTRTSLGAAALLLAMSGTVFAGNKPAVTYPDGVLATTSDDANQKEVMAGKKGVVQYAKSTVGTGVWYTHCPVMTNVILNAKHEAEVTLSNGKKIMLSSAGLKDVVEANMKKYEPYMYGSGTMVSDSTHMAQASIKE